MVQTFTGQGRGAGFKWHPRDLRSEEAIELEVVVSAVTARLRQETGDEGALAESRESALAAKVARLEKDNEVLTTTLRLAQIEIKRLSR